jgi:hypothetical protein
MPSSRNSWLVIHPTRTVTPECALRFAKREWYRVKWEFGENSAALSGRYRAACSSDDGRDEELIRRLTIEWDSMRVRYIDAKKSLDSDIARLDHSLPGAWRTNQIRVAEYEKELGTQQEKLQRAEERRDVPNTIDLTAIDAQIAVHTSLITLYTGILRILQAKIDAEVSSSLGAAHPRDGVRTECSRCRADYA